MNSKFSTFPFAGLCAVFCGFILALPGSDAGLSIPGALVTTRDELSAGILVEPTSGLLTGENGDSDSFAVVLTSQPTADVTIELSSSDPGEGLPSPTSLTFTTDDWDVPKTVAVTGQDDPSDDDDIDYLIETGPASSEDSSYAGQNAEDVLVINQDDDTAGFTFEPAAGLVTTEGGGLATFSVRLNSQPSADVSLQISVSDTTEAAISPGSLVFSTGNWDAAVTVTVTGVNDRVDDGHVSYSMVTSAATSLDPKYSGLDSPDISAVNQDDDTADILINRTGIETSEAGEPDSFVVVLNSEPTAQVMIHLSSSDTTEGSVSPGHLEFTPSNWDQPQTVNAHGVDDFIADGDVNYAIQTSKAESSDPLYAAINPPNVSARNIDNDQVGIHATPIEGLVTSEAGATATFNVMLESQPEGNVKINLASTDTGEGSVSPTELNFTSQNWSILQPVTVQGKDDFQEDGNQSYKILTTVQSQDSSYDNLGVPDINVTNSDNDVAGITINQYSDLVTTEVGGTATFTVTLNTEPLAEVKIKFVSSDLEEGLIDTPMPLIFTPANWNLPRAVTIRGVDDLEGTAEPNDGNIDYTIVSEPARSEDPNYNGMNMADLSALNDDDDGPRLEWVLPVVTYEIYDFEDERIPFDLEVRLVDSFDKTQKVRIKWWNAKTRTYMTLVDFATPPYRLTINPKFLNFEWNQIFAVGYDDEGDTSKVQPYIWLFRGILYRVFSPFLSLDS